MKIIEQLLFKQVILDTIIQKKNEKLIGIFTDQKQQLYI